MAAYGWKARESVALGSAGVCLFSPVHILLFGLQMRMMDQGRLFLSFFSGVGFSVTRCASLLSCAPCAIVELNGGLGGNREGKDAKC